MEARLFVGLTVLALAFGCSSRDEEPHRPSPLVPGHPDGGGAGGTGGSSGSNQFDAAVQKDGGTSKTIGDTCVTEDGWVATNPPTCGIRVGDPPQSCDGGGNAAPKGVGFCLYGLYYPNGYFTANCDTDADCSAGTWCSGGLCWKSCTDSSECAMPSTCDQISPVGSRDIRRLCRCVSCVNLGPQWP
jgi:hypothetical protein